MHGRTLAATVAAVLAALLVPAGAAAAPAKPVVTTGAAANVGISTVTLTGRVNPREAETTWYFQYGTTSLYGAMTAVTSAGSGNRAVAVTVPVGALTPATRYHYRLIGQNARGIVKGRDRTFRTLRQPLGVALAGSPNPVRAGGATTLAGTLSGTGNAGRQVVLQANPFPYLQGFQNVANNQVTNAQGGFAFPVVSVPVTTQFRVLMPHRPEVVSPVVVVGAAVEVTVRRKVTRRGLRRPRVRLRGRITPAAPGTEVLVQRLRATGWATVGRTFARDSSGVASTFVTRLRPRRSGRFRVLANAQGAYVGDVTRSFRIRVRR